MKSYFQHRIYDTLGLTEEYLTVSLKEDDDVVGDPYLSQFAEQKIVYEDANGNIVMFPFRCDGTMISFRTKNLKTAKPRPFEYIRFNGFKPLPLDNDGEEVKARPRHRDGGTHPLIPPNMYRFYKKSINPKAKLKTDTEWDGTLYFTEGYLKALKADFHGLPIIGLSSISHYRTTEGDKQIPYPEVQKLIEQLKPKRLVLLHDADVFDLKYKSPIEHDFAKSDMAKRLHSFAGSVNGFRDTYKGLCKDIWYGHIHERHNEEYKKGLDAKGLDDLLVKFKGNEKVILDDLRNYDGNQKHFQISKLGKKNEVRDYFFLSDKRDFYKKFKSIITDKPFIWNRGLYQAKYDDENRLIIEQEASKETTYFICVGNEFYEKVEVPKYAGTVEGEARFTMVEGLDVRKPAIIKARYPYLTKSIIQDIAKNYYVSFTNFPAHGDRYQQIVGRSYNLYKKLSHKKGPFELTENYQYADLEPVKHSLHLLQRIFGQHKKKGELGDPLELALDYVSIMYKHPTRKLPIVCLISEDNKTGKSTFMDWLLAIFQMNGQYGTSDSFKEKFNYDWINCNLIVIDEAIIDKNEAMQKLKMLSTAKQIRYEIKNGASGNIDVHFKFIFASNSYNFMKIEQQETRFWPLIVPPLKAADRDSEFSSKLIDEIPAFIHLMESRPILHPDVDRMWFAEKYLQSELLQRIKQQSKSWDQQLLEDIIVRAFEQQEKWDEFKVTKSVLFKLMDIWGGDHNFDKKKLNYLLQTHMGLKEEMCRAQPLQYDSNDEEGLFSVGETKPGRFYTFNRSDYSNQIQKSEKIKETEEEEDLPF